MDEEIKKELTRIARRRYYNNRLRVGEKVREAFKFEDGLSLLLACYEGGFRCHYCEKQLKLKDLKPYLDVPSIDHKVPLSVGGSNEISNCVVCCHQCNIIKGTLTENTFVRLLGVVSEDEGLLQKLFEESFKGKLAYKMERLRVEKELMETKIGGVNGNLYRCTNCEQVIGPIKVLPNGRIEPDHNCVDEQGNSYAPKEFETCSCCGRKFQFKDGKVEEVSS